jgi:hypothetical protein
MISPKPQKPPIRIDQANHWLRRPDHPANRPKRNRLTIAVGFTHDGGLLLCADTKVSGAIKENQSKLDVRTSNNGYCRIAFAMSGIDLNFPKSAVEKCWEYVQKECDFATDSIEDVAEATETSLAEFYRDYIFPHPDRVPNVSYLQFLVGIWLRDRTRLYVSYETLLRPVERYECIGSASYLAKYLIGQYIKANPSRLDFADAELMATVAVRSAIEYDEACGGIAELLTIENNGTVHGPVPVAKESFRFVEGIANLVWKFHRNFIHLENRWVSKELDSEYKRLADEIQKLHTSVWFDW